jgi:hypothetical protein
MPPRVETIEATSTELHRLYIDWSTFYEEVSQGTHQLPEHVRADLRVPGTVRVEFNGANERNSVIVWPLANKRDPVLNMRFVHLAQEADGKFTRVDRNMSMLASGLASYQQTDYHPNTGVMRPRIVGKKHPPSFNEALLFDDTLSYITTPNTAVFNKQSRATRLAGWLFNRFL